MDKSPILSDEDGGTFASIFPLILNIKRVQLRCLSICNRYASRNSDGCCHGFCGGQGVGRGWSRYRVRSYSTFYFRDPAKKLGHCIYQLSQLFCIDTSFAFLSLSAYYTYLYEDHIHCVISMTICCTGLFYRFQSIFIN